MKKAKAGKINIRAHHLTCIPRFKGGSYNKKIRRGLFEIQKKIKESPDLKIKVIKSCDEICKACPFNKNSKCEKRPGINRWIKVQDNKVLKELGAKENSVWKAREILNLSVEKIKNMKLKQICRGCEFLPACIKDGLNKSFINKLGQ